MTETAGAALIAREIEADCMKWVMKPPAEILLVKACPYIYFLREARAKVLVQLQQEEITRILGTTDANRVGLRTGEKLSGKKLLLSSDETISKEKVGVSGIVSGRHKRQYVKIKLAERCIAFVISTWRNENIEPPEPIEHLIRLYSL